MSEDNGLDVLLHLLRQGRYTLSEDLVRECYCVEKQFQYDRDREVPLNQLRRLVEAEAARHLMSDSDTGD